MSLIVVVAFVASTAMLPGLGIVFIEIGAGGF